MKRIMFVCHGNICRSPLAEFLMKDLLDKRGISGDFSVSSAATSGEEAGNPIYPPVKDIMRKHGIPFCEHYATKLRADDYEKYDLFVLMDSNNMRNIKRIFPDDSCGKIHLLLEFDGQNRDVLDPWYYGNFEGAYRDIKSGCTALLNHLTENGKR